MKYKAVIADKFPDKYIDEIRNLGVDVDFSPKLGENDLPDAAKDANIIVVRSTKVNEKTINAAAGLKLIIRAGSGVNNINIPEASKKGIPVCNCPGKNAIAVAELAAGLMVAMDRSIPDNVNDFNKGVWNKAEYSKSDGIYGKTIGIIGMGNIGKEVAKRASAFGMKVYGMDVIPFDAENVEPIADVKELIKKSDVISVHLPANDKTKNMFNNELFGLMKEGTIFINTSREGVVDQDALINAVKNNGIRAALDVFKEEPEGKTGEVKSPLQNLKNVYVTHHIGASTNQAQNAVAEETVRIVKELVAGNEVPNCVNKSDL